MEKLFLFEVLVEKIEFMESYVNYSKADVIITTTFGNVLRLDIQLDKSDENYQTLYASEVKFRCGKSYLFSCDPDALQDAFNIYPLEIQVSIEGDPVPIGIGTSPWSKEFNVLTNLARTEDIVRPTVVRTNVKLQDLNNTKQTAIIHLIIRLSYFGTNIQTNFEVKSERGGNKKYLFKTVGAETKFQMQKYGSGTSAEMVPVAPLFGDGGSKDERFSMVSSLDPVFIRNSSPPASFYNIPIMQSKPPVVQVASDILSLMGRPDEKEFFNVLDFGAVESERTTSSTDIDPENMSVDEIRKHLCNDPDCPGTQKFIELGIHPLAKNKNLGGITGPTNIPLDYGLSQTYGVMERYGPYGYYSKPKRLEEPFRKLCKKCSENSLSGCGQNTPLRLTGGNPMFQRTFEPLRLHGGGSVCAGEDGDEFPQPMAACKDLMNDFDKLLAEYKKAMGPCGKATCPYSGTIIQENCKKLCKHSMDDLIEEAEEQTKKDESAISACGTDACPHSRKPYTPVEEQFKAKQLRPACGAATCPYTKQKIEMGLDADALAKTCGSPKCPGLVLESLPPLEPVHWECPDPLPKGLCKNPDCPYLPKELKVFKPRKGPCGGVSCPYAPPPWCGSPVCPFGPPKPCPFAPPQIPRSTNEEIKVCPLPDCPFMNQWPGKCDNPQCPHKELIAMMYAGNDVCGSTRKQPAQNADDTCDNPECPYASKTPSGVCPFVENKDSVCKNPDCPYQKKQNDICENPECPYQQKQNEICENPACPYAPNQEEICENPFCPFAKKSSDDYCGDPTCPNKSAENGDNGCPFTPRMEDICSNPDCPFAPNQKDSPCFIPDQSSSEVCHDPTCPLAFVPPHPCMYPYPTCAYRPPPVTCGVPDCPYDNIAPCPGGTGKKISTISSESKNPSAGDGAIPETEVVSGNRHSSNDPCSPTTCGTEGGDLKCDECIVDIATKSAPVIESKQKKSMERATKSDKGLKKDGGKKKRRKGKYVYSIGDKYPGVHIGHRECCAPGYRVPAKMGWLWNIHSPNVSLKPRRGWRPGAIGRTIAKRIYDYRKSKGMTVCDALTAPTSKRRYQYQESEADIPVCPKPTLQIKKKDGAYFITMNPLKDPKTLVENENPYMDCTPLQFKITKNKEKEKMKKRLDDGDNNEMKSCYCDEYDWPEVSSESSSDSELDIEFTPPAGIIKPERFKRKKNVVHTDTQYNPDDCKPEQIKLGKKEDDKKGKKDKKGKQDKGGKGEKEKKGGKEEKEKKGGKDDKKDSKSDKGGKDDKKDGKGDKEKAGKEKKGAKK